MVLLPQHFSVFRHLARRVLKQNQKSAKLSLYLSFLEKAFSG